MPFNKVRLYVDGVDRRAAIQRKAAVSDLVAAIGISFSGKGFKEYIKSLGAEDG
jgi:hypothetical protein